MNRGVAQAARNSGGEGGRACKAYLLAVSYARTCKKARYQDATIYDRSRRQLIPCYDEFYGIIPKLLPLEPPSIADTRRGQRVGDCAARRAVSAGALYAARYPPVIIVCNRCIFRERLPEPASRRICSRPNYRWV